MKKRSRNLVYSTDSKSLCPRCNKVLASCTCASAPASASTSAQGDGVVRLFRETKGRKGKGVTLVKGLDLPADELNALSKKLKSGCGVGGSVKAGVIELQTAEREKIKTLLQTAGFTVKIAGG